MIDEEKTPINVSNCASDNMVKENMVTESVEKVHETAVVTTVQVEQAASSLSPALSSSMIEGSRSALVMNSGSGLLQGNLPTLTKTSVDTSQSQVKSQENATTSLTNSLPKNAKTVTNATAQGFAEFVEKSSMGMYGRVHIYFNVLYSNLYLDSMELVWSNISTQYFYEHLAKKNSNFF